MDILLRMNQISYIRRHVFRIKQTELAEIAGVPQSVICRWERDRLQPRLPALRRIRSAAIERGLDWDDRWFFEAPEKAA